jgi:hypothetical protein
MNTFHICIYVWIKIYKKSILIILNECNALIILASLLWNLNLHHCIHKNPPSVSIPNCMKSTPSHTISQRCVLILSSPLHLNYHWLKVLWLQFFIHFASPTILAACPIHLILDHRKNILWRVKIMKILIMQFCTFSYFLALVSQYSQYPVPYDPQCVPSFTAP